MTMTVFCIDDIWVRLSPRGCGCQYLKVSLWLYWCGDLLLCCKVAFGPGDAHDQGVIFINWKLESRILLYCSYICSVKFRYLSSYVESMIFKIFVFLCLMDNWNFILFLKILFQILMKLNLFSKSNITIASKNIKLHFKDWEKK